MKKKFRFLFAALPLFVLTACGGTNPTTASEPSTPSEEPSTPSEVDKGYLIIDDMPWVFYGNEPVNIPITFTNPAYAKPITYSYNESILTIEDDMISLNVAYNGSVTVKATTEDFHASFVVGCHKLPCDNSSAGDVNIRLTDAANRHVGEGWTVVLGDSFFDKQRFWSHFYEEMQGNVFCEGISASTIETWIGYSDKLIYNLAPKNLIIHLGTNDFWDLRRLPEQVEESFEYFVNGIHQALPECHIYYTTIENRAYKMPHDLAGGATTLEYLNEFNSFLANYCASRDYMTCIDSFSYFSNPDGSIKSALFKDGTHPIDREYHIFADLVLEAGCKDFTWKDIWGEEPEKLKDTDDHVYVGGNYGSNFWIPENSEGVYKKNYSVKGTIKYDFTKSNYGNPHISLGFNGNDANNRMLIWGQGRGNMKVTAAIGGIYNDGNPSSYSVPAPKGEFTYQFLVSSKSCYLFINGELRCAAINVSLGGIFFTCEDIDCTFTGQTFDTASTGGHYTTGMADTNVVSLETSTTSNQYWRS